MFAESLNKLKRDALKSLSENHINLRHNDPFNENIKYWEVAGPIVSFLSGPFVFHNNSLSTLSHYARRAWKYCNGNDVNNNRHF